MKLCYECMRYAEEHNECCPYCNKEYTVKNLESTHLLPGTILSERYIVGKSIGQGGFGITYVGLDIKFNRKVAIKELFPKGIVSRLGNKDVEEPTIHDDKILYDKLKDKFTNEARALAKFDNEPGIVKVFDFFDANNTTYIVMEFIEGNTLEEHIGKDNSMPVSDAINMLLPIMKSLKAIHGTGLIHRDISPSNILVSKKGAVLIDFGAARFYGSENDETKTVMYKLGYAPLEQYDEYGNQGPWTDIYAMCGTIYRCITGKVPKASTARVGNDLDWPSQLGIDIATKIEETLIHGLAIKVEDRIKSTDELIEGLTYTEIEIGDKAYEESDEKKDVTVVKSDDVRKIADQDFDDKTVVKNRNEINESKNNKEGLDATVLKLYDKGKRQRKKEEIDKDNPTEVDVKKESATKYVIMAFCGVVVVAFAIVVGIVFPRQEIKPENPSDTGELVADVAKENDLINNTIVENSIDYDENYFMNILVTQENVPINAILAQKVFEDSGDKKSSIIFEGSESEAGTGKYYDGTLWYVNETKAKRVTSGVFIDTGDYVNLNGNGFVYIDYYESDIKKSAIYLVKDETISEANISRLGYYGGKDGDDVVLYFPSLDHSYSLQEDCFSGLTEKPYNLIYDPKENTFLVYRYNELSRGDVCDICGVDLFYEIEQRGYNVINAFNLENGVITVNYYGVSDEIIEFDQVNWDINKKCFCEANSERYVTASGDIDLDDFQKSGYGGLYYASLNDLQEVPEYFKDLMAQLTANNSFRRKQVIKGSKVIFGTFEQNSTDVVAEDIVWRVLDIKDGNALLLSEYVLDYEPYNAADTLVSWENCTLRQYMNVPFYEYAFTDEDRARIVPTQRDTVIDNIFALSHAEVDPTSTTSVYHFPLQCEATPYAITQKGAKVYDGNNCRWWSSTANGKEGQIGAWAYGSDETGVTKLDVGTIYTSTSEFLYPSTKSGIRPALWVTLDK